MTLLQGRAFAYKFQSGQDNFSKLPNHKEFFNDMYYQQDDDRGAFDKQAMRGMSNPQDFKTEGQPFHQRANLVPGGILSHYKKHINVTP